MIYAIIGLVILLYFVLLNYERKEHFRSYEPIQDYRDDLCEVYRNSFFDAHLDARDEVEYPFMEWCHDFKTIQRHYPEYRAAERVFLKFKKLYG